MRTVRQASHTSTIAMGPPASASRSSSDPNGRQRGLPTCLCVTARQSLCYQGALTSFTLTYLPAIRTVSAGRASSHRTSQAYIALCGVLAFPPTQRALVWLEARELSSGVFPIGSCSVFRRDSARTAACASSIALHHPSRVLTTSPSTVVPCTVTYMWRSGTDISHLLRLSRGAVKPSLSARAIA